MKKQTDIYCLIIFVVINKGISDHGHFVQCLTSLIINSTSMDVTEECIDFYRKAFDDEETEVQKKNKNLFNKNKILKYFSLDSYSCISMS